MKDTLITAAAFAVAIPVALGTRLLPLLETTARYLWDILVEPPQAVLATVVPMPVSVSTTVEAIDEAPVVKQEKTSTAKATTKRTVRKRATKTSTPKAAVATA